MVLGYFTFCGRIRKGARGKVIKERKALFFMQFIYVFNWIDRVVNTILMVSPRLIALISLVGKIAKHVYIGSSSYICKLPCGGLI